VNLREEPLSLRDKRSPYAIEREGERINWYRKQSKPKSLPHHTSGVKIIFIMLGSEV